MITVIVSYVRSNEVNDIFKIARLNTMTQESNVEYMIYPRTMDMTEDDVRAELED